MERQVVPQQEPGRGGPIGPLDWHKLLPFAPAASDQLGWTGLEAASAPAAPSAELDRPPLTHHTLVLFTRPPEELDLRYEGVKRHRPPLPDRSRSCRHAVPVALARDQGVDARLPGAGLGRAGRRRGVRPGSSARGGPAAGRPGPAGPPGHADGGGRRAGERRGARPSRLRVAGQRPGRPSDPPPHGTRPDRGRDGTLPRARLRAVVEYVEEHLDAGSTLDEMAAVARLSPCHFARLFKTATGLPPHQYVILRRVERAKELFRQSRDLALAEIAALAGFSD